MLGDLLRIDVRECRDREIPNPNSKFGIKGILKSINYASIKVNFFNILKKKKSSKLGIP